MLKKGKVVIECLFAKALREQTQICQWHMMLMHKYDCQYVDIKKITVDIPKWLQFSEMSVLRCEQQPGEMTDTGRRSAQMSGAGSDLLVCGHEPLLGKVQHAAAMVTARPLPSR